MSGFGWRPTKFHRGAVICGAVFYLATFALLVPRLDDLDRQVVLVRNIGMLLVLALPLALAILSLWRRPMLLLPAAAFSILISPLMWSGLPLVFIPGAVYAIAFLKAGPISLSGLQMAATIIIPVALGITALGLLFSSTTHTCAGEGGGVMSEIPGGVTVAVESGGSFRSTCADVPSTTSVVGTGLIVITAVGAAAYVATPRRQPLPPFSHQVSTAER